MPNCVTYATARISEILNRREYLDDPRINGAQELWTHYSQGFHQSRYAQPGALMIWSYGRYGHVAVCEELIATDTITWSQSNYGGAMFEYVKGNPNGYKGMQFLGYLIHDELLKTSKPHQLHPHLQSSQGKSKNKGYRYNVCKRRAYSVMGKEQILYCFTGEWNQSLIKRNLILGQTIRFTNSEDTKHRTTDWKQGSYQKVCHCLCERTANSQLGQGAGLHDPANQS